MNRSILWGRFRDNIYIVATDRYSVQNLLSLAESVYHCPCKLEGSDSNAVPFTCVTKWDVELGCFTSIQPAKFPISQSSSAPYPYAIVPRLYKEYEQTMGWLLGTLHRLHLYTLHQSDFELVYSVHICNCIHEGIPSYMLLSAHNRFFRRPI